jgi:hypothetical protein
VKRVVALGAAVGLLAIGPACAKKEQDKIDLQKLLQKSSHASGVFRYTDTTPTTPLAQGREVSVRGLVEDDFRYKARLAVDGQDALDEIVADDALAVRFLDPSFIPRFTAKGGADAATLAALNAHYWVADPYGAPSIGDAAVTDNLIGVDPIVDALSVVDYVNDAIAQAQRVEKFNAERLDYRPLEDPFPRPAPGSGVTRWDLVPKPMPRADAADTGQGNASLARISVFRQMAIYVKGGRVLQVREQIAAKYDLLDKFRNYIERYLDKGGDSERVRNAKAAIEKAKDQPDLLEAVLNAALNGILKSAGEQPVRFHSMKYEFSKQGEAVHADLPAGDDVKRGNLAFFGVNSVASTQNTNNTPSAGGGGDTATTTPTTVAP